MKNSRSAQLFHLLVILVISIIGKPILAQNASEEESIQGINATVPPTVEKVRHFDEKSWKKATEGIDYSEKEEKEKTPEKVQTNYSTGAKIEFMGFGQVILIVVLGIVLVVLIVMLKRSIPPSNPAVSANDDWFAEALEKDGGPDAELNQKLNEALSRKEYSIAIRLLYLQIIADLHLKKIIHWKKDKTNLMYQLEYGRVGNMADFRDITYLYEVSWFGKTKINQTQFDDFRPKMETFRKSISNLQPGVEP